MTTSLVDDLRLMFQLERELPLSSVRLASNYTLGAVSSGLHEAADNLILKAARAVRDDDDARARRLVERALALPFDDHEQIGPAWWAASMLMFETITDALEDCDEDDPSWVAAAEDVLHRCDPLAVPAVLGCLATIVNDYNLSPAEVRRCRRLVGTAAADAWDGNEPADPQQRQSAILAVLRAVVAYEGAGAQRPA